MNFLSPTLIKAVTLNMNKTNTFLFLSETVEVLGVTSQIRNK